jgi:hypothetical protein
MLNITFFKHLCYLAVNYDAGVKDKFLIFQTAYLYSANL